MLFPAHKGGRFAAVEKPKAGVVDVPEASGDAIIAVRCGPGPIGFDMGI